MNKKEREKIDREMRKKLDEIKTSYKNNPLVVKVSPRDIHRVIKRMIFQVVAWNNMNKKNPEITLQLVK